MHIIYIEIIYNKNLQKKFEMYIQFVIKIYQNRKKTIYHRN